MPRATRSSTFDMLPLYEFGGFWGTTDLRTCIKEIIHDLESVKVRGHLSRRQGGSKQEQHNEEGVFLGSYGNYNGHESAQNPPDLESRIKSINVDHVQAAIEVINKIYKHVPRIMPASGNSDRMRQTVQQELFRSENKKSTNIFKRITSISNGEFIIAMLMCGYRASFYKSENTQRLHPYFDAALIDEEKYTSKGKINDSFLKTLIKQAVL